jgi:hypothetical protein
MELPVDEQTVYVPAAPRPADDGGGPQVHLELRRRAEDGQLLALAFTSPQVLAERLGGCQPWIGLPMSALADLLRAYGVAHVAIDPVLDDDVWRWSARDLADATELVAAGG